jgi:hypothetical protein
MLREYFLRPFARCIREGKAATVMVNSGEVRALLRHLFVFATDILEVTGMVMRDRVDGK